MTSSIISDYVETDSVMLANLSFVSFAMIWLMFAIAMRQVPSTKTMLVGRSLLALAVIFILVAILFPNSVDPRNGTVLSKVQNLFARPGLFVGVILVSVSLYRNKSWKSVGPTLLVLSVAALILLVVSIAILLDRGFVGIGQRVIFALFYTWGLIAGWKLYRMAREECRVLTTTA